jgi:hypothetical protein
LLKTARIFLRDHPAEHGIVFDVVVAAALTRATEFKAVHFLQYPTRSRNCEKGVVNIANFEVEATANLERGVDLNCTGWRAA